MAVSAHTVIKTSHYIFWGIIVSVGVFHLGMLFLTIYFSYLLLYLLGHLGNKWLAVVAFVLLVIAILMGFIFVSREAIIAFPDTLHKVLPLIISYAEQLGIDLPFTDADTLKHLLMGTARSKASSLAHFLKVTSKELAYFLLGQIVAIMLFLSEDRGTHRHAASPNLFDTLRRETHKRFSNFYGSFLTVMGGQLLISLINTAFTGIFITVIGLPYAKTVIVATFLCGLLPLIGNIISNTIIVGIALTISLEKALLALGFLILLHKFEYLLNSKIIGVRIRNPMWMTLLTLIAGEVLMGIPGMILGPILLHYLRGECTEVEVKSIPSKEMS